MGQPIDNLVCWSCSESLAALPQPLSRHDHCPACFEVLHCCQLCRHFDLNAVDGCKEDRSEPPNNKSEANFCDYFEPQALQPREQKSSSAEAAARKLASLFGDDANESPATQDPSQEPQTTAAKDPRAALEALFKSSDQNERKD